MAHATTINSLVTGLITNITGLERNAKEVDRIRDSTVKALRSQSHARVNQFVVQERLDGLVEKFAVFNHDDLSDALQTRLDEVSTRAKWIPDILALFLELSDRPTENTKLADLISADQPVEERELTWEEIIADDPLDEADIWDDVERGYHSSGDEAYDEDNSEPTISTQASSFQEEELVSAAQSLLIKPDEGLLQPLRQHAQLWRSPKRRNEPSMLPEIIVVRETIAMLHGLPTNLFAIDEQTSQVTLDRKVTLGAVSVSSLSSLLNECTSIGSSLTLLRYSMSVPQRIAFLQSVQSSVRALLVEMDSEFAQLECALIRPTQDTVVSSIDIVDRVKFLSRPLERISTLFQQCSTDQFAVLDSLYDECCVSHTMGDQAIYNPVARVFLAGLETYLRSAAAWIDTGSVSPRDREISFVNDADANCDPGKLWQNRFVMRTHENGSPFAPRCLQHLAGKMYALGKTKAFLRRLNFSAEDFENVTTSLQSTTTLHAILEGESRHIITSFEQLLADALSRWIAANSTDCTPLLCTTLRVDHGLIRTLQAMPYVYFSKDGSLFLSFGELVFGRLERGMDSATDGFILAELAHSTLGHSPAVDAEKIHVTITATSTESRLPSSSIQTLSRLSLEYRLPWPIQNITRAPSSPIHSRLLTFLLQITLVSQKLTSPSFFTFRNPDLLTSPESPRSSTSSSSTTSHPGPSSPGFPPRPFSKLRHQIRTFLYLFTAHLTSSAAALHSQMEKSMHAARDVDEMITIWQMYETTLGHATLLAPKFAPLHDAVLAILEVGEKMAFHSHERDFDGIDVASGADDGRSRALQGSLLRDAKDRFDESLRFLVPGIRGVSRGGGSGGEQSGWGLEALAERLEWDLRV